MYYHTNVCIIIIQFVLAIYRAGFTRYYYNPETGRCETFTYGGCLGNGNNFEIADECFRTCEGDYNNYNNNL